MTLQPICLRTTDAGSVLGSVTHSSPPGGAVNMYHFEQGSLHLLHEKSII